VEKLLKNNIGKIYGKQPPVRSRNMITDIWYFFITRPKQGTFIRFKSFEDRLKFRHSILQRIGMDASHYSVLNVHKIGIDAPVNYIFDELLNWDGDSTCWPNNIAKVNRVDGSIDNIQILPFGFSKYPFGIKKMPLGYDFIPLFNLTALKIQAVPDSNEADNARYILFKCSGGYPIGFFSMYVRSSIDQQNEKEQSQLFFAVGFDFFGRKNWANRHVLVRIWQIIHNRVGRNVLTRFKKLSEWRFEKLQYGKTF